MKPTALALLLFAWLAGSLVWAQDSFYLKDGDRVVFYGDSITDQRLYTTFTETFVLTRFPARNITFVHSGWGGDRVSGGGGGSIDTRLARDVFPYRPTVVTVMLGMNDGRYRPFDQGVFDVYAKGSAAIVQKLKTALPGVRITQIRPSPYDEVTREAMRGGGYNPVMVKFGDYLAELAAKEKIDLADLNAPLVKMVERAKSRNAQLAERIIPDRVHPGPGGHLIMAAALLEAWKAPAVVSDIAIDAASGRATRQLNAEVSGVKKGAALSWTALERSLPMPVDMDDAVVALAAREGEFLEKLNRETLTVTGLKAGYWALRIDGRQVVVRTAEQWAAGVNLATLPTPMAAQAARVHALTLKHNNVHFARWRTLQVPLDGDGLGKLPAAISALDALDEEIVAAQRKLAQPASHSFELAPSDAAAAALPAGAVSIFNGKDLTGWHISQVNHHGKTQAWKVDGGAITGTQDKPGHGGILLTDKKYRNFEVSLDVNPDWGCDSGLFLRSNEKGEAYQVLLDYLEGGNIGGIYGEGLKGVTGMRADWQPLWKKGEWNNIRARIEGDVPHIQVWLNGVRVVDWTDTVNHLPGGAVDGMIAVQVHLGKRWVEGGYHRFRNITVRELP